MSTNLCFAGVRKNEDGIPEEEENFDEAVKAANMALVPTRVKLLLSVSALTIFTVKKLIKFISTVGFFHDGLIEI